MFMDIGDKIYELRASEQHWTGVGHEVNGKSRMGFGAPEQLSIDLYVRTLDEPEIPENGLSVYENGNTRIGEEGVWHLVFCKAVGDTSNVRITT